MDEYIQPLVGTIGQAQPISLGLLQDTYKIQYKPSFPLP